MGNASRLALILGALAPFATLADEPAGDAAKQGPRVAVDKNERTHVTTVSIAKEMPIELHTNVKQQSCDATMAIRYEQRNTVARVESTIDNLSCAACTGEYTIAVRVRDDSGESKTIEFAGKWERADDKPVQFTAFYPIGVNVDLINVRPKDLHCVCAAAEEPASTGAPKE